MKHLTKHLNIFGVLALIFCLQACTTSDDTDPDGGQDPVELSISNIVGRWGIQTTTPDGGTAQTQVPCRNTLEIQENGNFLIVDADEGTWLEGNATFNQADSVLTLTISGQVLTAKILSVSETAFDLQSTDGSGATQTFSVSQFVKLEGEDCASFTREDILKKWSINEFTRSRFVEGQLEEENSIEDIATNQFTIEFKTDGSALIIDYINEYDFNEGSFRMLDNHNLVVDFDLTDNDPGDLIHLENVQWPYWIFESVERDEQGGSDNESYAVTRFSLIENDEQVPTISETELLGKWSASSIAERAFLDGQMVAEQVNDMIPHNKMTVEFFESEDLQFIDLLEDFGFSKGSYRLLDGSNLLMNIGDREDGDEGYDLFQVMAVNGDEITLRSFERPEDHGGGAGGGEANDGHEMEYDLRHFEITVNKNSGDEPAVSSEELMGNWMVTEVEALKGAGNDQGEGPQVGMALNFGSSGAGTVSFQGQEVATFEYELLDANNVAMIFEDDGNGDGGESNDGHDEEGNYTIFHVNARPGGALELILYEPSRSDEHDGGGDGTGGGEANDGHDEGDRNEGEDGGPTYRLVMQKEG